MTFGHLYDEKGTYRNLLLGNAFSGPQRWLYGDWKVESGACLISSGDLVIDLDKIGLVYPKYTPLSGYDLTTWFMQCQKKFEMKLLGDDYQWVFLSDGSYPPDPPKLGYDFEKSTISVLNDDSSVRSSIAVDKMCKILLGLDHSVIYHVEKFIDNTNDRNDVYYAVTKTPVDKCSKIHAMVFNKTGGEAMHAYYLFAECDVDTKDEAEKFFYACIPKATLSVLR